MKDPAGFSGLSLTVDDPVAVLQLRRVLDVALAEEVASMSSADMLEAMTALREKRAGRCSVT